MCLGCLMLFCLGWCCTYVVWAGDCGFGFLFVGWYCLGLVYIVLAVLLFLCVICVWCFEFASVGLVYSLSFALECVPVGVLFVVVDFV